MKATAIAMGALVVGAGIPLVGADADVAPMRATASLANPGASTGRAIVEGTRLTLDYGDPFVCEELNRGLDVVWVNGEGAGTVRFRAHGGRIVARDGADVIAAMRSGLTTFAVSDACGGETTFSVARLD